MSPSFPINNVKQGSSNPSYRVKIAAAQDASSPYLRTRWKVRPAVVFHKHSHSYQPGPLPDYTITSYGMGEGYEHGTFPLSDEITRDIALKKFKGKLQSLTGAKNLLIPIAELKDFGMLVGTLTKFTSRSLNAVEFLTRKENLIRRIERIKRGSHRKKKQYGIAQLQAELSELWLTWSFAVKPMLMDAEEIALSIAKRVEVPPYTRITASKTTQVHANTTGSGRFLSTYCALDWITETESVITHRFVGGFRPEINASNSWGTLSHFGFEPKNLVPTAYELLPFSWMLDYFTTVGDVLNDTFTVAPGALVYLNEIRIAKLKQKCTYSANPFVTEEHVKLHYDTFKGEPGELNLFVYDRKVLTSIPTRALRFKTSNEIGKSAVNKLLNLAAVLAGRGTLKALFRRL
jgi:hypothetical protein